MEAKTNGRHFADDIFKCIFLNENVWIPIKITLKCVPKCPMSNIPALVQIMDWRRPGDKPLSEPMMVGFPTHICIARPQWVNHPSWFIITSLFKKLFNTIQHVHFAGWSQSSQHDVIKWKHFPRFWPFVRGIYRSPLNSPTQRPVTRRINKSKQPRGWWFETPSGTLWRHRNKQYPAYKRLCSHIVQPPFVQNIAGHISIGCMVLWGHRGQLKTRHMFYRVVANYWSARYEMLDIVVLYIIIWKTQAVIPLAFGHNECHDQTRCFFIPHSRGLIQLFCWNSGLINDVVECSTQQLQNIRKNYEIDPMYTA